MAEPVPGFVGPWVENAQVLLSSPPLPTTVSSTGTSLPTCPCSPTHCPLMHTPSTTSFASPPCAQTPLPHCSVGSVPQREYCCCKCCCYLPPAHPPLCRQKCGSGKVHKQANEQQWRWKCGKRWQWAPPEDWALAADIGPEWLPSFHISLYCPQNFDLLLQWEFKLSLRVWKESLCCLMPQLAFQEIFYSSSSRQGVFSSPHHLTAYENGNSNHTAVN